MTTKPVSTLTRINTQLKKQGREERLVRGRGYYYLRGGDASALPQSAIYASNLYPENYKWTARYVRDLLADGHIVVTFEGTEPEPRT